MAEMKLSELAKLLGGELAGDGTRVVRGVASIESAGADEISFLANKRYEKHMSDTAAAAVLVEADYNGPVAPTTALVRCKDPYFAFREAMVAFYGFRKPHFSGVDARTNIDPSAKIGPNAAVAPFVTVAADCEIGEGVVLYPGVYIGPGCRLGDHCTLHPNVTLYDGGVLGDRVIIHAGSSVGHDGFGFATHAGRHEKIPQAGHVEIADDVEIGACCAIDRATLGATVIGEGTKFSNLVAIGHGTKLGKHCLLVAQVGLAGSVTVDDYCVFAGQVGTVGHIQIGKGAKLAAQSGVVRDVPAGQEVGGSPAMPLADMRRAWMVQWRLPQIRTAVKRLTHEVRALKKRLGDADAADFGGDDL